MTVVSLVWLVLCSVKWLTLKKVVVLTFILPCMIIGLGLGFGILLCILIL